MGHALNQSQLLGNDRSLHGVFLKMGQRSEQFVKWAVSRALPCHLGQHARSECSWDTLNCNGSARAAVPGRRPPGPAQRRLPPAPVVHVTRRTTVRVDVALSPASWLPSLHLPAHMAPVGWDLRKTRSLLCLAEEIVAMCNASTEPTFMGHLASSQLKDHRFN